MPKQELLSLALTRVRSGALPLVDSAKVYAGSGHQDPCCVCSKPITPSQVEYEVNPARTLDTPEGPLYFHLPCYEAWAQVCRELPPEGRPAVKPSGDQWRA